MRTLSLILVGILVVLLLYSSIYFVDRSEYVYLTQFGRHVETFDGETDAGWHWKLPWPIQSVQRLDHRLQFFDLPVRDYVTLDTTGQTIDKRLTVGAYVCWQIAGKDGVDRFIRTVGSPEQASNILRQRVANRLGAEISNMPLDELISQAPAVEVAQRADHLRQRLLGGGEGREDLQELARSAYGIELVDISLRQFNHPASVRPAIFNRIRSERNKKVADYQSDGDRQARAILSAAERETKDILSAAQAEEQRLKKEADVKADEIRNQAHGQDPEFYAFLQKLEAYQKMLGDTRDVLLLSTRHELFDVLLKPPRNTGRMPGGSSVAGDPVTPGTSKQGGP